MSSPSTAEGDPPTDRERVLETLADRIREVDDRLEEFDPDDPDTQQIQIRWTRTLGYLAGQYRKLMKDTDIDEMEEDIELLQKASELEEQ